MAKFISGVPALDVVLEGSDIPRATKVARSGIYAGDPAVMIGGLVEAVFDARSVGQTTRFVLVRSNTRELARVLVDFGGLE